MDFFFGEGDESARARWALVGGLKEESRMYNAPSVGGQEEGLIILKLSGEEMKD